MATCDFFTKQMQRLANVFPDTKLTEQMMDTYFQELDVLLPDYLEQGVSKIIQTAKFFPRVSEIMIAHEQTMLAALEAQYGVGNANRLT